MPSSRHPAPKTRNPMARVLREPQYRARVVPSQRRAEALQDEHWADEPNPDDDDQVSDD